MIALDPVWSYLGAGITDGAGSFYVHRSFPGLEAIGFGSPPMDLIVGREVVTVSGGSGVQGDPWIISDRAQRGTLAKRHLRRAHVSMMPHHIEVFGNHGDSWDYTARWGYPFNWHMTTSCPGGQEACSWSVIDQGYPLTAIPDGRAKVIVYDTLGSPYWIGLIDENSPQFRVDGATANIVARGYALRGTDEAYSNSKVFNAFTPVYQIMDQIRADKIPDVMPGDYFGGGRSVVVRTADCIGRRPSELFNEMAAFGDLDDQTVYWFIRNHGDTVPYLDVLNRGQLEGELTYHVPIEWLQPPGLSWRTSSVINQAVVQYSRGPAVSSSTEGIAALDGTIRSRFIDGGPRLDGIGTAKQIGRSLVQALGIMKPSGSITIDYPHFVYDDLLNEIPLWMTEAGHQIVITGPIDTGNTRVAITSMLVTGTDMNMDGRTLTFSTENAPKVVDDISHYLREIEKNPQWGGNFAGQPNNVYKTAKSEIIGGGTVPAPIGSHNSGPGLANPLNNVVGDKGRIGYPVLPDGIDIAIPIFNLGNGNSVDSLLVDTKSDVQSHWPLRILAATMKSDEEASVSVLVTMQTYASGVVAETDLFTISTVGGKFSDTYVQAAGITQPLDQLVFPAGCWFQAKCTATDGLSPHVILTIYGQKLAGKTDPDEPMPNAPSIGTPPGSDLVSVSGGPSAGEATFTAQTTDMTVLVIEYGEGPDYGSAWPWDLEYDTSHSVVLDGFEAGGTYFYKVTAYNWMGEGRVIGAGSFMA